MTAYDWWPTLAAIVLICAVMVVATWWAEK